MYTEDAQAFVRGLNLELVDGSKLWRMIETLRKKSVASPIHMESRPWSLPPHLSQIAAKMKKRVARLGNGDASISQNVLVLDLWKITRL
jgi:restriction system protein